MDKDNKADASCKPKKEEWLKIILMSLLWLVFFALSFFTYYAIPAVIFASWAIIAWVVKACKADKASGSGYDRDF